MNIFSKISSTKRGLRLTDYKAGASLSKAAKTATRRQHCNGTATVTLPDGREVFLPDPNVWPDFQDEMPLLLRRHLALQPEDALVNFDIDAKAFQTAVFLFGSQLLNELLRNPLRFLAIRFRVFQPPLVLGSRAWVVPADEGI